MEIKIDYPWLNSGNRIFLVIPDKEPEFLLTVAVWRVMWRGNNERVIIHGRFPQDNWLLDLPEGCTFVIIHGETGNPLIYDESKVFMKFTDCRVRNKWIPKPVVNYSDEVDVLQMFLELDCKIEMTDAKSNA